MATRTVPAQASEARQSWFTQRRVEALLGLLFVSPYILHFVILQAGAMLFSLVLSFLETDLLTGVEFMGLDNYRYLFFEEPLFGQALKVTAIYTFTMVPLATILSLCIAVLLNQNVRFQGVFRTLYYMPAVVSGVAVALVFMWVLHPTYGLSGWLFNDILGIPSPRWFWSEEWAVPGLILLTLWSTGANMLLYLAGLQAIPTQLIEAARIDGAGAKRVFWSITLPLLTPVIFFNVIMNIIASFQVFVPAFVISNGGPNNATLTMVLLIYRKAFQSFHFGYASSIAWVLFLIILVFSVIVFRSQDRWVYYEGGQRR
jgi:multiple sugar transport system permease protein